jgi:hypothetical protein
MTRPATRVTLAELLASIACGEATKQAGPPARVENTASPADSVVVGSSAGSLAVRVRDADGVPVTNATIAFTVAGGTATPTSTVTDATGEAQSSISAGTTAGSVTVEATVGGSALHADATFTAVPGSLTRIVLAPDPIRLGIVGDTLRLMVTGQDAQGNARAPGTVTFRSLDPAIVSVNAAGTVRAEQINAGTSVIASNGTQADTSAVYVFGPNASACAGLALPRTLAVGEATTFQGVQSACLSGTGTGAEFVLVAYNADVSGPSSTTFGAGGLTTPPATARLSPAGAFAFRGESTTQPALVPDIEFHRRLLQRGRELRPLFATARQWLTARRTAVGSAARALTPGSSFSAIGATPQVGDIVKLNVNGNQSCTEPDIRAIRIMAIGSTSIIMADTLNPAGGFTGRDYQDFAARFDTLVYPLDVGHFGTPTDIDNNGRIGIVFTRAVNELTSPNSSSYVGGFFFDRDLFPRSSSTMTGCAGSNEGELFYMLAPDPTGIAYTGSTGTPQPSNVRATSQVKGLTTGTLAHEFQHLINASRRLYVNPPSPEGEVVWLNEGLSHIAEELLYNRESGRQPRQNLTDALIRPAPYSNAANVATYALWKADQALNFQRFASFLDSPAPFLPRGVDDDTDDALATRGATWSFLRYAADRLYPTDGDVWFKLVNSMTTGLGTLRLAFGDDPVGLSRDWTVANYLDDLGVTTDPRYQQASWNYRDIFSHTFLAGTDPLVVTGISAGGTVNAMVQRNSAGYYRLAVPAGGEGLVQLSTTGAPSASFQFVVIRTK